MFKFGLGDTVKDTITGFTGVVLARTEWMTGCNRYNLQSPKLKEDGSIQDLIAFDENTLELVKAKVVPVVRRTTGGPQKDKLSSVAR